MGCLEGRFPGRDPIVEIGDAAQEPTQVSVRRRPAGLLPVAGERMSLVSVTPQGEKETALGNLRQG